MAHQEARAAHRQHNVHLARSSEHATPRPVLAEPCRVARAVPALSARAPPCAPALRRSSLGAAAEAPDRVACDLIGVEKHRVDLEGLACWPRSARRSRACVRACSCVQAHVRAVRAGGRCVGGLHRDSRWSSAEPRMSLVVYGASTIWAVSKLPRHSLLRTNEMKCTVEAFTGRSPGAMRIPGAFPADARGSARARSRTRSRRSRTRTAFCAHRPPRALRRAHEYSRVPWLWPHAQACQQCTSGNVQGQAQSRRRCGSRRCSPGADVAAGSAVPAQTWQGADLWRCRRASPRRR